MKNIKMIPFNRPSVTGKEIEYIQEAFRGGHASGDGPFTKKCAALLEAELGIPKVLLTTSCTHALEMAALLLNIQPGDEFIVPSFTFVSTANAFVLRGARPVFIDIRRDTLNLDEKQLASKITKRTRAILPVHYAGVACEMDTITAIAKKHGVAVVEDNAHGLFGKYKGRYLGTFGAFATQSFHETKNFSCGEGGALLINDKTYVERAEIIREKGTDRSRFFRGQVNKYGWMDIGSSYVLSDLLAAVLLAQLESRVAVQNKRRDVWKRYQSGLAAWSKSVGAELPYVPSECEQSYHMFYVMFPTPQLRATAAAHLKSKNILAVSHYLPLNASRMGATFGGKAGDCPVTEDISDRLLRLPFHYELSAEDQNVVIESLCAVGKNEQAAAA